MKFVENHNKVRSETLQICITTKKTKNYEILMSKATHERIKTLYNVSSGI